MHSCGVELQSPLLVGVLTCWACAMQLLVSCCDISQSDYFKHVQQCVGEAKRSSFEALTWSFDQLCNQAYDSLVRHRHLSSEA